METVQHMPAHQARTEVTAYLKLQVPAVSVTVPVPHVLVTASA